MCRHDCLAPTPHSRPLQMKSSLARGGKERLEDEASIWRYLTVPAIVEKALILARHLNRGLNLAPMPKPYSVARLTLALASAKA